MTLHVRMGVDYIIIIAGFSLILSHIFHLCVHGLAYIPSKIKALKIDLNPSFIFHPLTHLTKSLSMGCADRVLSYWMQTIEREVHSHEAAIGTAGINATLPPLDLNHGLYLSLYTVFALVFAAGLFLEALMMMVAGMRSSNLLHFQCLETIMHAPVSWFEDTSAGTIISRFSSDLSVVDLYLPRYIDSSAQLAMTILLLGAVLAMVVPVMLPQLLVCFCLFALQMKTAMRISQDSKHIANDAMNPVQSTLAEIEQGQDNQLLSSAFQNHGLLLNILALAVSALMGDLAVDMFTLPLLLMLL